MSLETRPGERPRPVRPGTVAGVVVARFHEELTGPMKDSAVRELVACGVAPADIHVVWVPGSFELAIAARRLALAKRGFVDRPLVDCVIALGVVIRGETDHDRWVAEGTVHGLVRAAHDADVPVHLGVLTCATLEQARARALPPELGGQQDKGRAVARAAIETLLALDGIEKIGTAGQKDRP